MRVNTQKTAINTAMHLSVFSTNFNMEPIQTFVFMDFGCVGGDSRQLTEVSLLAVPRSQYLEPQNTTAPEPKVDQDLSPNGFDLNTYTVINNYINLQKKPVCLVSHNGNRFDFIILKRELQNLRVSLADDILCADSIYAFYDIHKYRDIPQPVYNGGAVRERFYGGDSAPPQHTPYTLGGIYEREVRHPIIKAHPASNDVYMMFRISHKYGEKFLAWSDQIQRRFSDVIVEEIVFGNRL